MTKQNNAFHRFSVEGAFSNCILLYYARLWLLCFPFPVCHWMGLVVDAEHHSDKAEQSASEFILWVFEFSKCNFQI